MASSTYIKAGHYESACDSDLVGPFNAIEMMTRLLLGERAYEQAYWRRISFVRVTGFDTKEAGLYCPSTANHPGRVARTSCFLLKNEKTRGRYQRFRQ